MRVGLDVDGILADFVGRVIRLGQEHGLREEDGWPSNPEEWTEWDQPGFDEVWKRYAHRDDFWLGLDPYPEAVRDLSFEPDFYVTARPCSSKTTAVWLAKHGFPAAPVWTVGPKDGKVEVIQALGGEGFVDDKPEHFIELNEAGIPCLLYDQPWNRHIETRYRVFSLSDVLTVLPEMVVTEKEG